MRSANWKQEVGGGNKIWTLMGTATTMENSDQERWVLIPFLLYAIEKISHERNLDNEILCVNIKEGSYFS